MFNFAQIIFENSFQRHPFVPVKAQRRRAETSEYTEKKLKNPYIELLLVSKNKQAAL